MESHLHIWGILRHRHDKLGLSWRKQFFRKHQASNSQDCQKKKKKKKKIWFAVFMFHVNLVSTFSEAIYRLIRSSHESISVLTFGFNNWKMRDTDQSCKWTISINVKTKFDF